MATPLALYVDPPSYHFEGDRLFEVGTNATAGNNAVERGGAPFAYLRQWFAERGVPVHTADMLPATSNGCVNAYVSLGMRGRYPLLARRPDVVLSSFFAFECPVVEPRLYADLYPASDFFKRIFSYSTAEALGPFLTGPIDLQSFRLPQYFDSVHEDIWSRGNRAFMVMINANKVPRIPLNELYSERLRGVAFFERFGEIDLYGIGWDGPAYHVGANRVPPSLRRVGFAARKRWHRLHPPRDEISSAVRAAYRGVAPVKADTLGRYTFSLCFENSALEGWVTEKIFDCFYSGTIPIYLGAPDITTWVSPDSFIDMRRFADYHELRQFLHALSPREIEEYRVAARDYLSSEQYRPFTKRAFAELVGRVVSDDAGIAL